MNKKRIFGWIGVIILGALGSAAWELLKPALVFVSQGILAVSTLGLDSLRDGIYADAPRFLRKSSGLYTQLLGISGLVTLLALFILDVIAAAAPEERLASKKHYFIYLPAAIVGFMLMAVRGAYADGLNSNFAFRAAQVAPYISEQEEQKLVAQYLRVNSRADYLALLEAIDEIAKEHDVELGARPYL